ncbi:cytochrome P450 [uncultured Pseudokineococcus sp.]|uniref:cytochrome P450 n=1 Tax=uncultured Pseudokineococcus sp. TaxID=1642928 RepID=UPI002629A0A3|nr:cytochrome P450 [uncultured Pseudokineococcus sp.]
METPTAHRPTDRPSPPRTRRRPAWLAPRGRRRDGEVPTASAADAVRLVLGVLVPTVARGAIARRPRVVAAVARLGLDARAVREVRRLRERYGPDPVHARVLGRSLVLPVEPEDVRRVLDGAPEPFSPASREKRGALSHFQPRGVLISSPADRRTRRPFNESVLDDGQPLHHLAGPFAAAVAQEAEQLASTARADGALAWPDLSRAWWRAVRRVTLGGAARDDEQVTDDLLALRRRANWSGLVPVDHRTRERFLHRVRDYVDAAEPGSLAALVAATPARPGLAPHEQVPQWLFAFDAAAWASARALELLAAHPDVARRVREEAPAPSPDPGAPVHRRPVLRSVVLESLRLWPTTPAVLRDTTAPTTWRTGTLPARASVLVFAPFLHRDETRLPQAHRLAPELWLDEAGQERTDGATDWPLVPFSAGPGMCPGRGVVLLTTSTLLAALAQHPWRPQTPRLDASAPLPGTLDPFTLRLLPA